MISLQRFAQGFSVLTASNRMSFMTGTTATPPLGLCSSGSQIVRPGGGSLQQLQRLVAVPGAEPGRVNDLLLLRPAERGQDQSKDAHVVFFHGDIQNFMEEMYLQPEGSQWLMWSLEQVALTLGRRFPHHHIWVVRASRMYLHKFCCYNNFVESNLFGAPEHSPDYGALRHLRCLLSNGMQRAHLAHPIPPAGPTPLPPGFTLTLVGFSKGCVVLNQMVYELAGARADPELRALVERMAALYWLDGGHPGGGDTWVTDRRALGELACSGAEVHAHVTPYEVCDPMRSWVGREHRHFVKTLEELGARVTRKLHFEDEPPSITNHFRVIQEF